MQQAAAHAAVVEEFRAVMAHASVNVMILRRGVLRKVASQACRMLGYTPEELHGRAARELYLSDADYADTSARMRAGFAAHGCCRPGPR